MKVPFSYLREKFRHADPVFEEMRKLLARGDFTLGDAVTEFERRFAALIGAKHAIGVANGTDALRISLRLAGVGPGDEVITGAHSFIASAGAIVELGAKPIFVDMVPHLFVMNHLDLAAKITPRTKAILPVHYTGDLVDMPWVMQIAREAGIPVIEDACQAVMATHSGRAAGTFGLAGCFSLHPLKNLNVWGDGGFITTNDDEFAARVRLYRNHGLVDRDHVQSFGCNSRLDTLQALVGLWLIDEVPRTTAARRRNAALLDAELSEIAEVMLPVRRPWAKPCFHLYMFEVPADRRDALVAYLNAEGVEAKVHYPIPMYRQACFGPVSRTFPVADQQAAQVVTLPVHEHLSEKQLRYATSKVREFFRNGLEDK